jgi:hypothetical protein
VSSSAPKPRVVVIKVDEDMSRFLATIPNASQFIRRAIFQYLQRGCPLCRGEGVVPLGIGEHFKEAIAAAPVRCSCCDRHDPIPESSTRLSRQDARRWQRFFNGEPYCCAECECRE